MLYFAQSGYLWLLLLIPALVVGYIIMRAERGRRLRALGDPALVSSLMPTYSGARGWVKLIFLCLALAFFFIGLARPQMGAKLKEHKTKGAEIMICLDVSNSMLAQDYTPSRLERAKYAISNLVDKLDGDRIGLIIFAGSPFVQLPITSDYISAKTFLSGINTGSIPIQGTAIGAAIEVASKSFSPQSEKSRAIIVITDGENHEDDPVQAAKEATSQGIKVYTVGVGSKEGKAISVDGELLKDREGNIVVTKLDEATLKDIARAGDGAYVHASDQEFGLNPIINELRRLEDEDHGSVAFEEYSEEFMYFFGLSLLFFVLEAVIGERRSKKKLF